MTWHIARRVGTALLCAGSALTGGSAGAATAAEPVALHRMVAACTVRMASNVCSVTNGASAPVAARSDRPPVFVVGAGAVDRGAYGYLQAGGKAMCARAQSACAADWSGRVCSTARRLWAD